MRYFPWVVLVSGLAILLAVPILVSASASDRGVGSAAGVLRVPGPGRESSSATPGPGLRLPKPPVRSALLSDRSWSLGPAPTRLRIEAIGLAAPIVPVGVDDRTMEVPDDVDTVGWYRFGARPGELGSTLLVAHVDSRSQGTGAFFRLRELQPGDRVIVDLADRSSATFVVLARRSYPKEDLPARVFSRSGPSVLTLVTCGGAFSESTRSYADNLVVFAVPEG